MTGAYLRVNRGGKWVNLEVEYLTDEERRQIFESRPPAELVNWLNLVCRVLSARPPLPLLDVLRSLAEIKDSRAEPPARRAD